MSAENMDNIPATGNNFYEKYQPHIRKVVSRILKNANQTQDIDDCVHTAYLEIMENLQLYSDTRGTMASFVTVIARSTAID